MGGVAIVWMHVNWQVTLKWKIAVNRLKFLMNFINIMKMITIIGGLTAHKQIMILQNFLIAQAIVLICIRSRK